MTQRGEAAAPRSAGTAGSWLTRAGLLAGLVALLALVLAGLPGGPSVALARPPGGAEPCFATTMPDGTPAREAASRACASIPPDGLAPAYGAAIAAASAGVDDRSDDLRLDPGLARVKPVAAEPDARPERVPLAALARRPPERPPKAS